MSKTYSMREMQRLLNLNGYRFVRCNGDHRIYKTADGKTAVVNNNLNKMVAQRLIKEMSR